MILKPARMEDWEPINRIARQVCELHASWGSGIAVDIPYPMDYYQELVQEKGMYAAWMGEHIVGYVRFYFWQAGGPAAVSRRMVSIDDIGVDEALRNQGIGQQIMAQLCELARNEGCSALNLYVDAPNESAIAFYEKCGLHIRNHGMTMTL